jgi:hypothetical protein
MERTTFDIRSSNATEAWQQALAEVPQTPALTGVLVRRGADLIGRFSDWLVRLRRQPRAERRHLQRQLGLSLAGIALLLAMNGTPAGAANPASVITVTNGTSTIAAGDGCSLPEAIINANNDAATHVDCVAGSGADTIDLATAVGLTVVNNATNGLPVITSPITIEGNGQSISRVAGSPDFRILAVGSGGNLTLNSATISGGSLGLAGSSGGGISATSGATVTIQNSTVSGNSVSFGGGGIYASSATVIVSNSTLSGNTASGGSANGGGIRAISSTVTVQNSTLSGNSARVSGAGIWAFSSSLAISNSTLSGNTIDPVSAGGGKGGAVWVNASTVTVSNSTLSSNSARNGGGLYAASASAVTVSNSTISGNLSGGIGGGIWAYASTVTVSNSTIAGNSAASTFGGGIRNDTGTVALQNSIVAEQISGGDCNNFGTLTSNGYNIESGTSCGFTGTGDLQNVSSTSLVLGSLADNGGPTHTRALGTGSVAVERIATGVNGCVAGVSTDQRGLPRAGGANAGGSACDVGAYELQSSCSEWDVNCDGQIDLLDVQLVAGAWNNPAAYQAAYDHDDNMVIDIIDVQLQVIHWASGG